jgi:hypothetical protein
VVLADFANIKRASTVINSRYTLNLLARVITSIMENRESIRSNGKA